MAASGLLLIHGQGTTNRRWQFTALPAVAMTVPFHAAGMISWAGKYGQKPGALMEPWYIQLRSIILKGRYPIQASLILPGAPLPGGLCTVMTITEGQVALRVPRAGTLHGHIMATR